MRSLRMRAGFLAFARLLVAGLLLFGWVPLTAADNVVGDPSLAPTCAAALTLALMAVTARSRR